MTAPLAFYNEHDKFAADWLRNLIDAGEIAPGVVDERDIQRIDPDELHGYTQVHLFAGVGGWSVALRLAGWPDERPVWTGSCPCQPLSGAGQRKGHADERHLWPAFHRLIAKRSPSVVFGEQVASADGREWLAGVRADLEALGYACGAADLCAAGAGAPHIRQRLFWLADADGGERGHRHLQRRGEHGQQPKDDCSSDGVGYADGKGSQGDGRFDGQRRPQGRQEPDERRRRATGFWSDFDIVACRDGARRRVEPGTFPMAHGAPARMGRLRAYGNAIVPQVAAEFIAAYMDVAGRGAA